jgi:hypothetical protein
MRKLMSAGLVTSGKPSKRGRSQWCGRGGQRGSRDR